jgi:ATP-binding cassette subfamily B protein
MTTDATSPGTAPGDPNACDDGEESEEIHARDLWAIARFVGPFSAPQRWPLLLLGLLLLIETVINFAFPLATQYLVDEGLVKRNIDALVAVLIFLAVAAVFMPILGVAMDRINARAFTEIARDIRQKLFAHVQRLSMPFFTRTHAGEVLSRFSGDIVALEGTLTTLVPWCLVPLLEVIYSVILMFWFNVWLGLIAAVVFPLVLLGPRFFAARAFELSYDKRRREAELLGAVQENVTAQPVVKAFGLQASASSRFYGLNLLWMLVAFRAHFLGALVERSSHTGVYLVHVLIFGLGAYWVFEDKMTIGTLVSFEATFLSMGYALTYVMQYVPLLAQAAGSIHHLDELFAQKPQVEDAANAIALPRLQREIVFDKVSFKYADDAFCLADLNVRIAKGSFIAFVGASGSGKSTVLNLLMRLYDPTAGAIYVDGTDIRTATQDSLRSQIGMVFQENYLFNTTILENIRMGNASASQEQVEAAGRAAEIHDFVMTLPRRYQTMVGERGSQLSGGQRQRLAIARALVRDPAILVLDEATSALDYATEAALNETLLKVAQNRTVIMVTHRLSSVISAAHIVVLDRGRVVESGDHEELLRHNGAYAALWRNQAHSQAIAQGTDECDETTTLIPTEPLVGVMEKAPDEGARRETL